LQARTKTYRGLGMQGYRRPPQSTNRFTSCSSGESHSQT
jgi:hypothetical protein